MYHMTVTASANSDEDLTIVLVHFNTPEVTTACVASLLDMRGSSSTRFAWRIVIVDNRSETAAFEALMAGLDALADPNVILVRNCLNAGFGLGCMLALNYSAAPYIAFVNSDTRFDTDCFSPLRAFLDAHPDVGVIGAQHLSANGIPERSFGYEERLIDRLTGRRRKAPVTTNGPVDVDYVFGAFMLFRREALAVTGGFDPTIFLFYEEMDVCQRLRKKGYRCVFHPGASFRHIGQASVRTLLDTKPESDLSLLYVVRKNESFWHYRALVLLKFLSYAVRAPYKPRYRRLLWRLMTMGVPQALSTRTKETCNFDFINRV